MTYIKQSFPVLEMSCAACAVSVESMLKSVAGVKNAGVNYANQSAWVEFDNSLTKPETLQQAVRSIGYDLVVNVENPQAIKEDSQRRRYTMIKQRTIWSTVLAIPVIIIGMFFMDMPFGNYLSMFLSAPVVFYFGKDFFVNAWRLLRHRMANMDTLVALSTGIAFFFSAFNTFFPAFWLQRGVHAHVYFEAASGVIAFISLGKLLEEKAKSKTTSAIKKLMGLQPNTVRAVVNGVEKEIPLSLVKVGDLIIVRPGDRIPVDGRIVSGASFIDESMISGEPVAVKKMPGNPVFAGTINQKGSFQFLVEKVGDETVLGHIIKSVQEAQGSKAPVQKLVDKVAGIFVPVVISISAITFITWMVIGGDNAFANALLTSITVLVIACPCALGLATPTAIMVGIGKGAENNILIRDAESLELAHRVNAIVLDKTGTITEGKPAVTDIMWSVSGEKSSLQNILYALEARSEHPLAAAIVKLLELQGSDIVIEDFNSITGKGVQGRIDKKIYFVGSGMLMEERGIRVDDKFRQDAILLQQQAKTVIYFSDSDNVLAMMAIADSIKPTSKKAIEQLQAHGVAVYMLTGDNEHTARAVAREVGITTYRCGVLPAGKAEFVQQLQKEGRIVAMVGDGINDSHALAQADVSIAMGRGSDIAIDVAKITLMTSDLAAIHKAINLSKKTVLAIRQNLFWAFIYNIIGIPLAAGVLYPINGFLLDPMIAGAAMALSSVSVVANSLRLKLAAI